MSQQETELELETNGLTFPAVSAGSPNDDLVLFVHGFPDNLYTFQPQLQVIADAGYYAVSVGLRGYSPASQPADGNYSLEALATDVVGWIDALGADKAHLIGHDWGAGAAYVAAAYHGDRLHSATAMSVPPLARVPKAVRQVPRQVQRSWYMNWFQVPGLSNMSARIGGWFLLRRLWHTWSPGYQATERQWASVVETFEQPGVLNSAVKYYRQNATPAVLLGLRSTLATTPVPIEVPVLIINGSDDGCMDRRMYENAIVEDDYRCGVRHEELAGVGHFLHWERPDLINQILIDHLAA